MSAAGALSSLSTVPLGELVALRPEPLAGLIEGHFAAQGAESNPPPPLWKSLATDENAKRFATVPTAEVSTFVEHKTAHGQNPGTVVEISEITSWPGRIDAVPRARRPVASLVRAAAAGALPPARPSSSTPYLRSRPASYNARATVHGSGTPDTARAGTPAR